MPPRYGVHGAFKNAKAENIFYDFFQCRHKEINMLTEICSAEYKDKY
jgi:hypothetical protein